MEDCQRPPAKYSSLQQKGEKMNDLQDLFDAFVDYLIDDKKFSEDEVFNLGNDKFSELWKEFVIKFRSSLDT